MIAERSVQVNKKVYECFVDYKKAFDNINHEKLLHIMEKAGIPELERKLLKALHWNQYAVVKTKKWKLKQNLHPKRNTTRLYHLTNTV